ncbi:MAG: JAB domain-containing protein [Deltaproteobacteria bacterium]|nr:JAB domain-containing protein [Deltaproteobacteria bacterium]
METETSGAGGEAARRAWLDGLEGLSDGELLALLLGDRHAAERAARADLTTLRHCRVGELAGRFGLEEGHALRLAAALRLGARAVVPVPLARLRLAHPADVAAVMAPEMAGLPRERVVTLVLDRGCRLLSRHVVAEGWREGAPLDPREVFRPAVVERGHAVIVVHNHPSGNPEPSAQDREVTRRLAAAGRALGTRLVDHVIVAAGGWATAGPGNAA